MKEQAIDGYKFIFGNFENFVCLYKYSYLVNRYLLFFSSHLRTITQNHESSTALGSCFELS